MNATPDDPQVSETPEVKNLEFKAALLLVAMLVLVVGSALYVMYARGVFEDTQRLVLISDDSEGVVVGMDMTFAGFPIGRVGRIELGADGTARILIDVPSKDAKWLRTSSIFTMERGLVGGTRIRAYSGVLDDPALARRRRTHRVARRHRGRDSEARREHARGAGERGRADQEGRGAGHGAEQRAERHRAAQGPAGCHGRADGQRRGREETGAHHRSRQRLAGARRDADRAHGQPGEQREQAGVRPGHGPGRPGGRCAR